MQVIKVLNNSLILALDLSGNECILMGKGIGYKQAIGNDIKLEQIEKIFLLKDKKLLLDFIQLASQFDETYFNLVREIITYAKLSYQIKVMDSLYLSLTDHIAFMVKRTSEGNINENFTYIDIVKYHHDEYQVGKFAINLIEQHLNITLPIGEASAIALHFINAGLNQSKSQQKITQLVQNIESIILRVTHKSFNRESFAYSRWLTHLNYFAERVITQNTFTDDNSSSLYQQIVAGLSMEKLVIDSIQRFIQHSYNVTLPNQELLYLFIHLNRIINESKKL